MARSDRLAKKHTLCWAYCLSARCYSLWNRAMMKDNKALSMMPAAEYVIKEQDLIAGTRLDRGKLIAIPRRGQCLMVLDILRVWHCRRSARLIVHLAVVEQDSVQGASRGGLYMISGELSPSMMYALSRCANVGIQVHHHQRKERRRK